MILQRPSPNHDGRPAGGAIDMLVLHYTGMRTAEEALARLCDPAAKVSAHYLIDEDGTLSALVAEGRQIATTGRSGLCDITVTTQDGDVIAQFRGRSRTVPLRQKA